MAELGVIARDSRTEAERSVWLAIGIALCLHLAFAVMLQLNYRAVTPLPKLPVIDVRLIPPIAAPSDAVEIEAVVPPQTIEKPVPIVPSFPEAAPVPIKPPLPKAKPNPPPRTSTPPPILNSESGSARGAFPAQADGKDYVPSQWALEPPLSDENLKGLGLLGDVDCLRALSEDCAALRKEVFAEYELTEMEKVWTPQRADTGMPSEFYGMSEREIRLKIGSKIAGENGFMILPGIGIDGSLWDMMHGVKKTCQMKRGINSDGRYEVVRVCPQSLPAGRDKKYYIPPKGK